MYPTFQQTFVYKMYTKCLYTKCIPHFDKHLYIFCMQKFSWHNSFDFVYKMYTKVGRNVVYILYTSCTHQLHTSCTFFAYKMYTQFRCGIIHFTRSNNSNPVSCNTQLWKINVGKVYCLIFCCFRVCSTINKLFMHFW